MPQLTENRHSYLVSSEILLGWKEAGRELNVEFDPVLEVHGLDPLLLDKPTGYLLHEQVTLCLQQIADRFNCGHFGFVVGKHQPAMQLGSVGQAMKASPTVKTALENGIKYQPLYSEGSKHDLVVEHDLACIRRWNTASYDFNTTQMRMLGIVMAFKIVKSLSGANWQPSLVCYSFSEPEKSHEMSRYFGCPILYDQEFDSLIFPAEDLARRVPTSDPQQLQIVLSRLAPILKQKHQHKEYLLQTENFIHQTMGTSRCTLESCAQILRANPRTLQRKLAMHDTTFKQLLLDIRMSSARQYLSESAIDLSALSELLGYQSLGAFSRAFKDVHGVPPTQWRIASGKSSFSRSSSNVQVL